jgi:hypothetical protein
VGLSEGNQVIGVIDWDPFLSLLHSSSSMMHCAANTQINRAKQLWIETSKTASKSKPYSFMFIYTIDRNS